jgi:thiol-disulfide isomerase/thioredoxin
MLADPCPRCNGLGERIVKTFDMNAMKDLEVRVPCTACAGTGVENRPAMGRRPLWVGLALLSLGLVAGVGIHAMRGPTAPAQDAGAEPPPPNFPASRYSLSAPDFPASPFSGSLAKADYAWGVLDLQGHPVPFSTFKGRTTVLNFWATWCGPCMAEAPSLDQLCRKMRGQPVNFVCVSFDKTSEKVSEFTQATGFQGSCYMPDGQAPEMFRTRGIPTTFILSPDGEIVFSDVGCRDWGTPASEDFLKAVIGHKT